MNSRSSAYREVVTNRQVSKPIHSIGQYFGVRDNGPSKPVESFDVIKILLKLSDRSTSTVWTVKFGAEVNQISSNSLKSFSRNMLEIIKIFSIRLQQSDRNSYRTKCKFNVKIVQIVKYVPCHIFIGERNTINC